MKLLTIGTRKIGDGYPVFIICEAGVTNYGDIRLARKQIDAAVAAGADAVKFQRWSVWHRFESFLRTGRCRDSDDGLWEGRSNEGILEYPRYASLRRIVCGESACARRVSRCKSVY